MTMRVESRLMDTLQQVDQAIDAFRRRKEFEFKRIYLNDLKRIRRQLQSVVWGIGIKTGFATLQGDHYEWEENNLKGGDNEHSIVGLEVRV